MAYEEFEKEPVLESLIGEEPEIPEEPSASVFKKPKMKIRIKKTLEDHYLIAKVCVFLGILLFALCIRAVGTERCQSLMTSYHHYNADKTVLSKAKNKLYAWADKTAPARRLKEIYKDTKKIFTGEKDGQGGEDAALVNENIPPENSSYALFALSQKMQSPLPVARLTSPFGYRISPIDGTYGFHTGIDLARPLGTPVLAAFGGEVIKCGESNSFGKYMLVRHSRKITTFYAHLSEFLQQEGAIIRPGEILGAVGSTGWSTGPHLHFELRIDDIRINPLPYLTADSYEKAY